MFQDTKGLKVGALMVALCTPSAAHANEKIDQIEEEVVFQDANLPERNIDFENDTVIVPETKISPPIVATEADKFALMVMGSSLAIGGLGWALRKSGLIKDTKQDSTTD